MYKRITDGTNIDPTFTAEFYGIDSKLNVNIKLPKNFSFQANGEYYSRDVTVIGSIFPRYFVDMSLQKKILKDKGKISFRVSDVFNSKEFHLETNSQGWKQEAVFKQESRIAFVTFTYDFGKKLEKEQKEKKPIKKDSDDL